MIQEPVCIISYRINPDGESWLLIEDDVYIDDFGICIMPKIQFLGFHYNIRSHDFPNYKVK